MNIEVKENDFFSKTEPLVSIVYGLSAECLCIEYAFSVETSDEGF